jgi:FKBP-type peptidyl-prolyl cis-trans isomerase
LNIGNDLRMDKVDVDLEHMAAGIVDGFKANRPKWSEAECAAALRQFQRQMQSQLRSQHEQYAVKNKRQADAFLAKNKTREGVTETASGLQYEVLEPGDGPSPTRSDTVRVHYRGTLIDGTEFDSSLRGGKPIEFQVGGVISGWTEALQKMRTGDKWRLFVPPQLAYGVEPPGPPIEPNSLLIFEVQLLEIVE